MQERPSCLGMSPSGVFTVMHQDRKQVMMGLPSIPKKSSVLLPTLHLVFAIQGLPCKKKKKAKVKLPHISANINVQIFMYYLKEHSCSPAASLSTSYQISFSQVTRKAKKFCNH